MGQAREPDDRAARAAERLETFVASLSVEGGDASGVLEPAAVTLFSAFRQQGIDALLLKGAALDRLLYTGDEHRSYSDLDILVCPAHQRQADELMLSLGYRNGSDRLGIDDVGEVVHAETWMSPIGIASHEIDVHRWLPGATAPPPAAWDALWQRHTTIDIQGEAVPVLDRAGLALHLAVHAAQHGPAYAKGIRELSLGLQRWPSEVWTAAAELARAVGAVTDFGAGLRLAPGGVVLAAALRLPDDLARDWEIRHLDERPRGAFHAQAFSERATLRERASLLRRALLPNPRWLTVEFPWLRRSRLLLPAAYLLHLARAPLWASRAWNYRRRARRGGA